MSTLFSIGQMNQLADALEAAGFTPNDVTRLRSKVDALKQFRLGLSGRVGIKSPNLFINCDTYPFIPDGYTVVEHIKSGKFCWDPDDIKLYLSEDQMHARLIEGNQLRKDLKGKPVLNACVLDSLLVNQVIIPEEWKSMMAVCFWGTIYRDPNHQLCIRFLAWDGERWYCDFISFVGNYFGGNHTHHAAAVRVES